MEIEADLIRDAFTVAVTAWERFQQTCREDRHAS